MSMDVGVILQPEKVGARDRHLLNSEALSRIFPPALSSVEKQTLVQMLLPASGRF